MSEEHALRLVETEEIEIYPISSKERLDAHYFVPWNLKRWRGSEFRRHGYADPEVGWFGRELFEIAQDETPVGTLPCNDEALAFLLRMPIGRWKDLRSRSVTPLHGWYQVQCDNGQTRLAHPVVTEVALAALGSKKRNDTKNADDRMRKRLGTIVGHLKSLPGAGRMAESDDVVNKISDWIDAQYPGGSATMKRVKEALNDLATNL